MDVGDKYANYEFDDTDDRLTLDGQPECLQWAYTPTILIGHRTVDKVRADTSISILQGTRATKLSRVQRMKENRKRGMLRQGEGYMAMMIHHNRGSGIAA